MPFVREDIPKEYIEAYKLENTDFWLIDRENDAAFYYQEGHFGTNVCDFIFRWKGVPIEIRSEWKGIGLASDNTIEWNNTQFRIPRELESKREEIRKVLIDAFSAYGFSGRGIQKKTSVTVTFANQLQRG